MKNLNTLRLVGKILGRNAIVIAVKSYNAAANKITGHSIHLYSDKETGITLYTNGQVLYGKYKKENERAIDFVLNPQYALPWTSSNNTEDAKFIKERVSVLRELNSDIDYKHKAVNAIITNYEDFLVFCLSQKYMQYNQINHLSTKMKYKYLFEKKEDTKVNDNINTEVASAQDEASTDEEARDMEEPINNRTEGSIYLTFKPGLMFYEDCYGNILQTMDVFYDKYISSTHTEDKLFRNNDVYYTEKAFIKHKLIDKIDKSVVIVRTSDDLFTTVQDRIVVTEK